MAELRAKQQPRFPGAAESLAMWSSMPNVALYQFAAWTNMSSAARPDSTSMTVRLPHGQICLVLHGLTLHP